MPSKSKAAQDQDQKTVLIIDDEVSVRKSIHNILASEYRVLEAENYDEARVILESASRKISLLLIDIALPWKKGLNNLYDSRGSTQDCPESKGAVHVRTSWSRMGQISRGACYRCALSGEAV